MKLVRRVAVLVSVVATAAAAVAVEYAATARPRTAQHSTLPPASSTAAVERGTVTQSVQISGTLGYDGSYQVVHHGQPGTLTAAPAPGTTIDRGGVLYAVANLPTRLLFGSVPAYRDFTTGMTDGPDVRELEQNLVALGLDPHRQITVDDHFNAATKAAILRWQASWGWPLSQRTGQLGQGQVAFLPTSVRITTFQTALGGTIAPDSTVLAATSTNKVITAPVSADRQALLHVNDVVQVTLPGTPEVQGKVTKIGRVAAAPTGDGQSQGGSDPNSDSRANAPTIMVTIAVSLPAGAPELDQTPVEVSITTETHPDVLLVPISALLARPGGGYQVRLSDGSYLQVEPGLFDEAAGKVEVTGAGLTEGQEVQVPAS
jgi:Putative peptidoglycan binding domain